MGADHARVPVNRHPWRRKALDKGGRLGHVEPQLAHRQEPVG